MSAWQVNAARLRWQCTEVPRSAQEYVTCSSLPGLRDLNATSVYGHQSTGAAFDTGYECANSVDRNGDLITGLKREFVRRHDASSREQNDTVWEALLACKPCD